MRVFFASHSPEQERAKQTQLHHDHRGQGDGDNSSVFFDSTGSAAYLFAWFQSSGVGCEPQQEPEQEPQEQKQVAFSTVDR